MGPSLTFREWDEHVADVSHRHLLRLGQLAVDVVEVDLAVVGHETDLHRRLITIAITREVAKHGLQKTWIICTLFS